MVIEYEYDNDNLLIEYTVDDDGEIYLDSVKLEHKGANSVEYIDISNYIDFKKEVYEIIRGKEMDI